MKTDPAGRSSRPARAGGSAPHINIVGCGRAAVSLARLWLEASTLRPGDVLNRSPDSSRKAVQALGAGTRAASLAEMAAADYWLIGTGDDQIAAVVRELAGTATDLGGALIFHLAGRLGLEVMDPVAEKGALVAALHPVRSLSHAPLRIEQFRGTACVAEGSDNALYRLRPLVESIGGEWLPVSGIDRGLYHAAVSIVSNVTKGVAWKAQKWLEHAGLPTDTSATVTAQLLSSTVDDLFRAGARQSITGPVVRGDTHTVEAHLTAIGESHPEDVDLYRVLARTVLELAQERGDLDAAVLARFKVLLASVGADVSEIEA